MGMVLQHLAEILMIDNRRKLPTRGLACVLLLIGALRCARWEGVEAGEPAGAAVADGQVFDCDHSTPWWRVADALDPTGAAPAGAAVQVTTKPAERRLGSGALRFSYDRRAGVVPVLFNGAAELTQLKRLSFWIRSRTHAVVRLAITDRDGARFHWLQRLRAGSWTRVTIRPEDLQPNRDSPIKKTTVDPRRLGTGFGLFDIGGLRGRTGRNDLWIDDVRIDRRPIQRTKGAWVVGQGETTVITEDRLHEGPIEVRGHLVIKSSRFVLHGSLVALGGTVTIDGTVLRLVQRFRFDRKFIARDKASMKFLRTEIASAFPTAMEAESGSVFALHEVRMLQAGLHGEARAGCTFVVDRVINAGEFVLSPTGHLRVLDSSLVLIWFAVHPGMKTALELPDGAHIKEWKLPASAGSTCEVSSSRNVMWGLLTTHDSDVTIRGSTLRAIGIVFAQDAPGTVKSLRNATHHADTTVAVSDRTLRLVDTKVTTWNLYALLSARLTVRDCLFGEAMVFNQAEMEIHDSTCDGTGGFIGVLDTAKLTLVGCKVTCDVNTYSAGRARLEKCTVTGNVTAAGRSRIYLVGTPVVGRKLTFDSGEVK